MPSQHQITPEKIIELVSGSVDDVKGFVNSRELSQDQVIRLLNAEKAGENRPEAIGFLTDQLKAGAGFDDEVEEKQIGVLKALESSSGETKLVADIEGVYFDIDEDVMLDFAGHEFELLEPGDTVPPHRNQLQEEPEEKTEEPEEAPEEEEEDEGEEPEEQPEEAPEEEPEEDGQVGELKAELRDHGFRPEEIQDRSQEELEDMLARFNEKRSISDTLELDLSDSELRETGLEELRKLQDERNTRQEMIDELAENGMDREELRNSSTKDLKQLYHEVVENDPEDGKMQELDSFESKIMEEKEKEAEEDLEMLMGAVKKEEEEPEGPSRLEDIKERFNEIWKRKKEEENQELDRDRKAEELLEHYRSLDNRECAIKTAHVMKGYLEYKLEISRELTYGEMAENLEQIQNHGQNIETLVSFFRSMQRDEYTGNRIVSDMDQVLDAAKQTIEELS